MWALCGLSSWLGTTTFEWSAAKNFVLGNGLQSHTCCNEFRICPQNTLPILGSIIDTIGRAYVITWIKREIFTLTASSFCNLNSDFWNLEITNCMIHCKMLSRWDNIQFNPMVKIVFGVGSAHNKRATYLMWSSLTFRLTTTPHQLESKNRFNFW